MDEIRRYKVFTATPIWVSILHLIAVLFFQTNFNINESKSVTGYGSYGFLFGSSQMFFNIVKFDLNAIRIAVSISTIILALILVFSSYFSLTKNTKFIYLSLGVYSLDYIFSIVGQILPSINNNISLNFVPYFFSNIIHIIGISLIVYSLYVSRKIKEEKDG